MTNAEILDMFCNEHPEMSKQVKDYRPLDLEFVKGRVGITIWLSNDDIILYFPKKEKKNRTGEWENNKAYKL